MDWDGDGYGEWPASERPCLAIRADHPLASVRVSMDTSSYHAIDLRSVEPGKPVFLELPQLPVGIHTLKFSAKSSLAGQLEPLDDQAAVIRIREDRPHSSVVDPGGPLLAQIDPALPTMQQLWEGEVEIMVRGPPNREVGCRVSLFERDGDAAILSKQLPPLQLPVTSEDWAHHFHEYFREREDAQEAYDMASLCGLDFDAHDLGVFTFRLERASTPVRWALRRRGKRYVLRLFDDSGHPDPPILNRMAFETPDVQEEVTLASEIQVPEPGGLYVARTGGHLDAIVVPSRRRGYKREELLLTPKIKQWDRSLESTMGAVETTGLWGQARLPGDLLATFRRRKALCALVSELSRLLCGGHWSKVEEEFSSRPDTRAIETLTRAVSTNSIEARIGTAMIRRAKTMAHEPLSQRIDHLASAAIEHRLLPERIGRMARNTPESAGGVRPKWLAEFALRLASDPASVGPWAGPELRAGLNSLLEAPSLMRIARLLVIATTRYMPSQSLSGELYPGWKWKSDA